jgi:hypothetical protein
VVDTAGVRAAEVETVAVAGSSAVALPVRGSASANREVRMDVLIDALMGACVFPVFG